MCSFFYNPALYWSSKNTPVKNWTEEEVFLVGFSPYATCSSTVVEELLCVWKIKEAIFRYIPASDMNFGSYSS